MSAYLVEAINNNKLPDTFQQTITDHYLPLASQVAAVANGTSGTMVLGVMGSQGSGKSTLADFLRLILENEHQLKTAVVSIDDFYLTRAEREKLATDVHPLLLTRGVPGTHDLQLAKQTLDLLTDPSQQEKVLLPRFDKANDDRADISSWPSIEGAADIVILEGWCVGVGPQAHAELETPINSLETNEDSDGVWRKYANDALEGPYAELFSRLDHLVVLAAPSFECVYEWRQLQEDKLRASTTAGSSSKIMSEAEIERFIAHYERLTRHALNTLPKQCDWLMPLARDHSITALESPMQWQTSRKT